MARRTLSIPLVFFLTAGAVTSPIAAQDAGAPSTPIRHKVSLSRPIELFMLAGPIAWPILLCSLATITLGLERMIALRRRRVLSPGFVRKFRRRIEAGELDRTSAVDYCRTVQSPAASMCLAAARLWGRPVADVQKAVAEAGGVQIVHLRKNLRVLQAIANIATLLGLLGTVFGMIHSFNNVSELRGLQRGEELSRGIAEALVATAFGLAVAIPSLALYTFFSTRVERLIVELDDLAGDVADLVSAEGLSAAKPIIPAHRRGDSHRASSTGVG
nr:Tol-Pal system protein TolQ [uncultured bacterium]